MALAAQRARPRARSRPCSRSCGRQAPSPENGTARAGMGSPVGRLGFALHPPGVAPLRRLMRGRATLGK
eukprot:9267483-Lingulodinium_polyedra.AAC.1